MRVVDDSGEATWEYRDNYIKALMTAVTSRSTQKVEASDELLTALVWAQARHTANLLMDPYNRMGDDWGDDTRAALDCMEALFSMVWDQSDTKALETWLNTPPGDHEEYVQTSSGKFTALSKMGCDGVCPELYQLDCPALPKG